MRLYLQRNPRHLYFIGGSVSVRDWHEFINEDGRPFIYTEAEAREFPDWQDKFVEVVTWAEERRRLD